MVIGVTTINPSSVDEGGDGTRSTMVLESLARVDLKEFSQTELYSLARSSSSDYDLQSNENIVIPNVSPDCPPPQSITTTTEPSRIFAFSHRRGPRRRISASVNDEADPQLIENRLILSSLQKLIAEGEANDSNPRNDTLTVDNEGEIHRRKRRRKSKAAEENEEEFEGLDVINLNGEEIDLKFLARAADGAFDAELKRMTEGMVREDEFLGFMKNLEGRWGSSRKRRKYIDAAYFLNALPGNWKILLSLRPRIRQPCLYCRRFVSPSDVHFKSCKDVAFYLKSQFVTNDVNPHIEGAMIKIEPDCQVIESVAQVPRSTFPDTEIDLSGTNNLRNVPIYILIECRICRDSFTSIGGLESHMEKFHGTAIQRLDIDTLTGKSSVPCDVVCIQEPKHLPVIGQIHGQPPSVKNSLGQKPIVEEMQMEPLQDIVKQHIPLNGEGSSGVQDLSTEPKNDSQANRKLKIRCMWCLVEFFGEPGDEETLTRSPAYKCPKCEEEIKQRVKSMASKLNQRAEK